MSLKLSALLSNRVSAFALAAVMSCGAALGAAFTPGNLTLLRVGDGSTTALGNASTNLFVDEYTTAGSLVQTIAIPTNGATALTVSGSATSEGALSRAANGQYISFAGYNTNVGIASIANSSAQAAPRGVGILDASGNYTLAATVTNQFSANNIRSAATDGASNFWAVGGNSGVYYFGLTAASNAIQSAQANNRVLQAFNSSLFFSAGSGTRGIHAFTNAGFPTVATGSTNMIATGGSSSPYGFSINAAGDVIYIADDSAPTASGGIQKWTNSGTAWSLAYIVTTNASRGLVVDWSGANPVLYATTVTNSLITVTDTGAGLTATLLARGATGTALRGVTFAPVTPVTPPSITAQPLSTNVECGTSAGFSVSASGSAPLAYQWFRNGSLIAGATNSSLDVTPATSANTGNYTVVVSNSANSVTSSVAALTVTDTAAPLITVPSTIVTQRTRSGGAVVTFSVSATDSCVGSVPVSVSPASGSVFPAGTNVVTCVAGDGNGNTNTTTFNVVVLEAVTPHFETTDGAVTNVLGGTVFINKGLVGIGHISSSLLDAFGESFGSMSGMQITGFTTNADGTYSGVLNVLPDRGYNSGAFYADFAARINQVGFTFRPYYGTTNIGGTTDLEKLDAQTNQFSFGAISGVRFTYFDPNTGSNSFTTGLDPGTNSQVLWGKAMPYVKSYTGIPFPGSTATNTYTGINKLALDSEALVIKADGSGYIGDEYGEAIYYFNPVKQIIGAILPPQAMLPHSPSNVINFTSVSAPVNGRRNNQGFEGVSLSPDGTRLFALQQSASVQDADAANNQRAKNTRLLIYDVSTNPTPTNPIAAFALQLPIYKQNGNGAASDRTCAQSEIVALDNTRFLVLSRDGNGLGNAVTNPNVYKVVLLVDTAVGSPTDFSGDAARNAEAGKITTSSSVLDPVITPLSWVEAVNLLNGTQLGKFNVTLDNGTNQVTKLTMGEKWEGMSLVSCKDPANPNDYFLFVGNDNDFVTSAGVMKGPDGTNIFYNAFDGYPANRVPAPLNSTNSESDTRILAYRVSIVPGVAPTAALQTTIISVTNRIYSPYSTSLTNGQYVYVDADVAAGSVVRATQRALGYREVDYKSQVPPTLAFTNVVPTTNGNTITFDYSGQTAKTAQVGFWVDKDVPILIGPDGNAYITDGHHTTAGYLAANIPGRQIVPGLNRVILGHVVANYYNSNVGPQPADDSWWTARAAENNAYLFGVNGDALTLSGEPNYASLQPILPSVAPMPNTPSAVGAGAMLNSVERSLTWGLADGIVISGTTGAGAKIAGYKKSAPGSSVDINFVEFYWSDFLRHRVVWDNTLTGSPFNSPNGDASVIAAPLSFFTAVANGIALARSEIYRDEYGRLLTDYTNSALFPPVTVNWASGSRSNGFAAATDTYNLYLRDDSTIAGAIQPSALSTNILHVDTASALTVTQAMQNIRTAIINAGGTLRTAWKDATVSNSTLRLPAGTGVVTVNGNNFVAANTILGGGSLLVNGTLTGSVTVTNGTLNGNGTITGGLAISGAGNLAPGASIGVLTIGGPLTLNGSTTIEINKSGATLTNDQIVGITALTYGGGLVINATGDALAAGDSFTIFGATSYSGAFASFTLPALDPGLVWDTSRLIVDGTISVANATAAPTIARQPSSATMDVGGSVTLTSGAVGGLPISYLWLFNGGVLSGQTGTTLLLANIQESSQGAYQLVAQNAGGSVTSSVAVVTVNQSPVAQAQSRTVYWNRSWDITLAGTDADGDALTYSVVTQPAHGTVSGSGATVTYTPASSYFGPDSFTFRVNDGRLNSATATVTLNVKRDFDYVDTDLLLVFRKTGFNDLVFNLGTVSNYLGQANGSVMNVSNFEQGRVSGNFGGNLSGVKFALVAVTPADNPSLRAWLTAVTENVVTDETFTKWSSQRSKINAIGVRATAYSYPDATNNSLSISPSDPNSYSYIASSGGTLDIATLGGAAPFPIEQDLGSDARLFELHVSTQFPKPAAVQVGHFTVDANANVTFTGGFIPPTITGQPSNQSVIAGSPASFSVSATGEQPLSYQWFLNNAPISGANSSSYNIGAASVADAGSYYAVVGNVAGSVTSSVVTLTVSTPPSITQQPVGGTITLGGDITFSVTASGDEPLLYQWRKNGNDISGANASSYSIGNAQFSASGNYSVVVANGSGSVTSSVAVLTAQPGFTYRDTDLLLVFRKPGFNDLLFNIGTVSNFLGQANGSVSSVTSYLMPRIAENFGGNLSGVKYALLGVTPADDAVLRAWLSISAPGVPTDETFTKWSSQRSKINAIGVRATAYGYPAATNNSLSISPSDPNSYTYIASSGGTLDIATLGGASPFPVEQDLGTDVRLVELHVSTQNPKPAATQVGHFLADTSGNLTFTAGYTVPTIASQPVDASAACGTGGASFSVSASGDVPFTYQWYHNSGAISGATGSTLNISPVSAADAGTYFAVVSNAGGSVTSSVVNLTVTDNIAPVITTPANILVTRTSANGAVVTFNPTATDNCLGSVPVVSTPASGSTFPVGTTLVTCVATDGSNSSTNTFTVTVQVGFTYQDTDLLLAFRKPGFNDLLFNLGSVSNYLGQATGTTLAVTNFEIARLSANFGGSLAGVKYSFISVTRADDAVLRAWLSDSVAGTPTDETFSKWTSQRSKINAIGSRAAQYFAPEATNQSLSISPSDPNSYSYIATSGGTLDVSTLGGAAPFPIDQDVASSVRFFELKVSTQNPKPAAVQAGSFTVAADGAVTFNANRAPVANDDGAIAQLNTPLNIAAATLLANDTDADGDALTVTSVSSTSTNGGTVSLSAGTVTYTPVNGFSGTDRFTYTISDGRGGSATANVEVFVSSTPVPAFNNVGISAIAGGYRLVFRGTPGTSYRIQRTTDLNAPIQWTDVATRTAPLTGIISFDDTSAPTPNAFYRLVTP